MRPEGLGVESRTHHHVERGNRAREAARNLKGTRQDGILTARRHNLSKEQAKQDQTASTASDLSEPLTQRTEASYVIRQGDAGHLRCKI